MHGISIKRKSRISRSTGYYKSLPDKMTYYSFEAIYHFIEKVRNDNYDWRRVLGLPEIRSLPLSKSQQEYLFRNYERSYASVKHIIMKFAEFYDRFSIIYGKYKHGLTIQAGLVHNFSSEASLLGRSILVCYDRRDKKRMPKI
jgi:hypothetical protein